MLDSNLLLSHPIEVKAHLCDSKVLVIESFSVLFDICSRLVCGADEIMNTEHLS